MMQTFGKMWNTFALDLVRCSPAFIAPFMSCGQSGRSLFCEACGEAWQAVFQTNSSGSIPSPPYSAATHASAPGSAWKAIRALQRCSYDGLTLLC